MLHRIPTLSPLLALVQALLFLSLAAPAMAEEKATIREGSEVSLEFRLTLEDGTEVISNTGRNPLVYTQGEHKILPALEKEMKGLKVGDSRSVTLPPEKAFGAVDPQAFHEVDIEQVPEKLRQKGAPLVAEDADGNQIRLRVSEVKEDTVLLDFNHPLAGKTVTFHVRVLEIH